jgi:hypothetical protein
MTTVLLERQRVVGAVIRVPAQGPWYADVDLEEAPDLTGRVTLAVGSVNFVGTIDERFAGTFALQRRVRIVAGAGAWGSILARRGYHSDGGVRAQNVANDAARDAGENLIAFEGAREVLGNDFVRAAGAASVTLEHAAGGVPWWVDYDGNTRVGEHPSTSPAADAYEVLEFDPRSRVATLAVEDVGAVRIGATLSERLDSPLVVRELEILVGEVIRVNAWCGPADARGRLLDAFRAIIRKESAGRIVGTWRYRVARMTSDSTRYELQAVRGDAGLPDVIPCSAWPGIAGSHSIFDDTAGAEVLVEFIEGDPTMPIITHFAGKDGVGWIPREAIMAASVAVRLASATADKALALAHKSNDRLDVMQNGINTHTHVVSGSVTGGTTIAGTAAAATGTVTGTNDVGSSKVFGVD